MRFTRGITRFCKIQCIGREFSAPSFSINLPPIIASKDNEKAKLFRALQIKKKRDDTGLIVLEGGRQIVDAIRDNFIPKTVFMTEKIHESTDIGQEIVKLCHDMEQKTERNIVHLVTDSVFNSVSETMNGQGVIATFRKPVALTEIPSILLTNALHKPLLIVVLDQLSDPGNMGTLLRSCYGLGVD